MRGRRPGFGLGDDRLEVRYEAVREVGVATDRFEEAVEQLARLRLIPQDGHVAEDGKPLRRQVRARLQRAETDAVVLG